MATGKSKAAPAAKQPANPARKETAERLRAAAAEARHGDVRAAVAAIAETMADALETE